MSGQTFDGHPLDNRVLLGYINEAVKFENPKDDSSKKSLLLELKSGIKRVNLKLCYAFLSHIFTEINGMNVMCQSEHVRVHSYLTSIECGLKKFCPSLLKNLCCRQFDLLM